MLPHISSFQAGPDDMNSAKGSGLRLRAVQLSSTCPLAKRGATAKRAEPACDALASSKQASVTCANRNRSACGGCGVLGVRRLQVCSLLPAFLVTNFEICDRVIIAIFVFIINHFINDAIPLDFVGER